MSRVQNMISTVDIADFFLTSQSSFKDFLEHIGVLYAPLTTEQDFVATEHDHPRSDNSTCHAGLHY